MRVSLSDTDNLALTKEQEQLCPASTHTQNPKMQFAASSVGESVRLHTQRFGLAAMGLLTR